MNEFPFVPTIVPSRLQVDNFTAEESLRDYFAAKAIQGIAVAGALPINDAARIAYEYADAMLEARKR